METESKMTHNVLVKALNREAKHNISSSCTLSHRYLMIAAVCFYVFFFFVAPHFFMKNKVKSA